MSPTLTGKNTLHDTLLKLLNLTTANEDKSSFSYPGNYGPIKVGYISFSRNQSV